MQKIISCLWVDKSAEEAVNFYLTVFKNSKKGAISHYGKEGFEIHGMPEGTVLTIEFELEGQKFLAMNGGPVFKFNEAVSFMITCENQEKIDYYWEKLTEGGDPESQQCGWLKDKFGLSWQVVPEGLDKLMTGPNSEKVIAVLLKMKKLVITDLEKAATGT